MSNYSQLTVFTSKDSLITGNPLKLLRGAEFDAELAAISTAIASKLDSTAAAALGANPTATIGLSAVNGAASTYIRSDGAPALSQAIAPTWTGAHTFTSALTTFNRTTGNVATRWTDGTVISGYYSSGGSTLANFGTTSNHPISFLTNDTPRLTLSAAGNATFTGLALFANGLVGGPSVAFASDPTTGMYRRSASQLGFATAGVDRLVIDSAQFSIISTNVYLPDGVVGTPGLTFNADTDTGIWRAGANRMDLVTGGTSQFTINGSTIDVNVGPFRVPDGLVGTPSITFFNNPTTGLYRFGTNGISITVGGTERFRVDGNSTLEVHSLGEHAFVDGTTAFPGLVFDSDIDTGIFRNASNALAIAAGATFVSEFRLNATAQQGMSDGAVGTPAYSFNGDYDSGFYRIGANQIGVSVGGALVVDFFGASSGAARVADLSGSLNVIGYRSVPRSTTATTLVANDVGKCVAITAAINIPASVFAAGDAVSIYNDSAGALNLTISAGTLRLGGTATTGTRSIAARGTCTIWFNVGGATPEVIASGNVT